MTDNGDSDDYDEQWTKLPPTPEDDLGNGYVVENFMQTRGKWGEEPYGTNLKTVIRHSAGRNYVGTVESRNEFGNLDLEHVSVGEAYRGEGVARRAVTRNISVQAATRMPEYFTVSVVPDDPAMEQPLRHLYTDIAAKVLRVLPIRNDVTRTGQHKYHEIEAYRFSPSVFEHLTRRAFDRARVAAGDDPDELDAIAEHQKVVSLHAFGRPPRAAAGDSEAGGSSLASAASDAGEDDSRKRRRRDRVDDESEVASDK